MACIGVSSVTDTAILYNNSANVSPPAPLTSFNLNLITNTIGSLVRILPIAVSGQLADLPTVNYRITGSNVSILEVRNGSFLNYDALIVVSAPLNTSATQIPFTLSYAGTTWFLLLNNQGRVTVDLSKPCAVTSRGVQILPEPPTPENTKDTFIIVNGNFCQAEFTVINPQGLCKPCCSLVRRTSEYRAYCLNVRSVLRNKQQPITFELEQYALVRLMLARLLYGDFNVQYLRQRYYSHFLQAIAKCYPNFVQFFDGNNASFPYANYWLLFEK